MSKMKCLALSFAVIAALLCGTLRVMADGPSAAPEPVTPSSPRWIVSNDGRQWDLDGSKARVLSALLPGNTKTIYIVLCSDDALRENQINITAYFSNLDTAKLIAEGFCP